MNERNLQRQAVEYLNYQQNAGRLLFLRVNSGMIPIDAARRRMVRMAPAGFPDLIIFGQRRTVFVELKSDTGKQTPAQLEFERKAQAMGYQYVVIRSFIELEALIVTISR